MPSQNLEELSINTIRMLSVDMVEKANSGHPGLPMGAAALAYTIWTKFLRHNPPNSDWLNRDRFVLSAGHGSALLYSLLHLTGYKVSLADLKNFRQWGSRTPGHPEYRHTDGVETTTGPLGQGFATGIGMALAQDILAKRYNRPGNKIIDYTIYGLVSDGDLMEGISSEAASYAGSLGLGKLIYLYDSNKISIEGSTDITFSDDVQKRFDSYNWHTETVQDGNNVAEITQAVKKAQADPRPSLIIAKTSIGFGSPGKQDSASAHGEPLGADEARLAKENLNWPLKSFYIPKQVQNFFKKRLAKGKTEEAKWNQKFKKYQKAHPQTAQELLAAYAGKLPPGWQKAIPEFEENKLIATRSASGEVLNSLAAVLPTLAGGSADLGPSNKTYLKNQGDIAPVEYLETQNQNPKKYARNIHFGVREHAMGAILNGLALSRILIPFGATFLVFSDYMRGAMRLSALMGIGAVYVFTHDSIAVGEDGPTHQPIEHLMSLRSIPGLTVIRPADARETALAWQASIQRRDSPSALILTRQNLPTLKGVNQNALRGAYILNEEIKNPKILLIASGSEVSLALEASIELEKKNIQARVISMMSWEIFEEQDQEYKDRVLPPQIKKRVSIEAGITAGWEKYTGDEGASIGINRFGASAPGSLVMQKFGFNAENVVKQALKILNKK